jgi:hypothetical protein
MWAAVPTTLPGTSYKQMYISCYTVNYITIVIIISVVIILFIYDLLKFFIGISYYAYVVWNEKVLNESGVHKFSKNAGATS